MEKKEECVVWGGVCVYAAYMCVHMGTLINFSGGLTSEPQEHPADIKQKRILGRSQNFWKC